jgi:predicted RNase H-like nuclease
MSGVYAGVDGCRKGWVGFVLPREVLVEGFVRFADLMRHLEGIGVTTVGVDMPLSCPQRGERNCDIAVKRVLGRFGSSLFMTPTCAALACETRAAASAANLEMGGKGVSAQAFALRDKIAEVASASSSATLVEVHPELSFHLLGPVFHGKRTWAGVRERVAVLESRGLHPMQWESRGWGAADDTLDAAVAAVSARRYVQGQACGFPAAGEQIWA